MTDSYSVCLKKAVHVFSAGHFITLTDDTCEAVHGHNWTVSCSISGTPDTHGMVIDFIFLRDTLTQIISKLDHCMLLPTENSFLQVTMQTEQGQEEVLVKFGERRWVFPADECRLLPLANTTAELLAKWIGNELIQALKRNDYSQTRNIRIEVDECFGQSASWENKAIME
jgi:6-pyruvoyltetrahydropterin/6-carboxytetrahydropterin synthase